MARASLPTVTEAAKELESEGFVAFGEKAYNQTASNCFEIACYLAKKFGFLPRSPSRKELTELLFDRRAQALGWGVIGQTYAPSPAAFVIRGTDDVRKLHITFEYYGMEYNFGPGTREGLPIERRIFLYR